MTTMFLRIHGGLTLAITLLLALSIWWVNQRINQLNYRLVQAEQQIILLDHTTTWQTDTLVHEEFPRLWHDLNQLQDQQISCYCADGMLRWSLLLNLTSSAP